MELNWPDSLGEITLKNLSMTELWFLRHTIDSGGGVVSPFAELSVRTPKFGYDECYVDIDDRRYLIKHKTRAGGTWETCKNVVFFVRKHKNPIGK